MRASASELFGPRGTPVVVVVGGGFGGIAAGVKLKKAGIETFTIIESSARVGGTWWDNQYPGCEVDVGSQLYSYSFATNDWSRTHATQPELQAYLERVARDWGLDAHLRLGTTVERVVWDEATHTHTVHLTGGEAIVCHVVISGVGFLNVPRYPQWPGLEDFAGPKFHTSRWDHDVDLTGKVVAVVGTGSTATQIVPAIAPVAEKVYLFQREPGWVMPKGERELTDEERAELRKPLKRRIERLRQLWRLEKNVWGGNIFRPGTKVQVQREAFCRDYIDRTFADRPDLREAITPTYPYPGKRPIFATTFYPSLLRDDVELVPRAVERVTPTGLVDADGVERRIDVLVMATGFQPANYLARLPVIGRDGRSLHDAWAGEPRAFLGITVPGFPNFFMLYGPGTNGGEIVSMLERQSEYAVRAVKRMMRSGVTAVEVRPRWAERYDRWLQKTMQETSWTMSRNYFTAPSGKVVTQWLYGPTFYGLLTKTLAHPSESTRRRSRGPHVPLTVSPEDRARAGNGAAAPQREVAART